ncbi:MAG: hypothetical protein IJP98_02300 [Clostridia bacterium]|nr:hypothetical protein [Clostridia bacterium]
MTGLQICNMAAAFLYNSASVKTDEGRFSVHFLNRLIAETFGTENSMRESEGREPLASIPWIDGLEKTIDYHDELLRTAFVYGLAAHYWQEELDTYQAERYTAMYINAVNECKRGVWVTI